jgi:hypothetical protein
MSFNQQSDEILTTLSLDLTIDEWIYLDIPCVLLYKDGFMDIYPIQEYTGYELTMLQRDLSYKSAWVPIGYGTFLNMQKCLYEILYEGLYAISVNPPELSGHEGSELRGSLPQFRRGSSSKQ